MLFPLYFALVKGDKGKAFILILAVILTDFFDGFLARKLGQETPLGQYLDPFADKVAMFFAFCWLWEKTSYPKEVILIFLVRESIGIVGGLLLLFQKGILGKPNWWGKVGISIFALSVVFYFLDLPYKEIFAYLSLVIMGVAMVLYIKVYLPLLIKGS